MIFSMTTAIVEEQEEESEPSEIPTFDRTKKPAYSALSTSIGGELTYCTYPNVLAISYIMYLLIIIHLYILFLSYTLVLY